MFIVLLKFSQNKDRASQFMEQHKEWVKQGFEDGIFLLSGSLQSDPGGGIMAYNTTLPELQVRVNRDPFVSEKIVNAEIIEIAPSKTNHRLEFLLKRPI